MNTPHSGRKTAGVRDAEWTNNIIIVLIIIYYYTHVVKSTIIYATAQTSLLYLY